MARIPLHFLPTFVAVAEHGSLRKAAATLHLTHGAVSQQITELESRLGFAVFERRSRGLLLNAAGALLLQGTSASLAGIEDAVRRAGDVARESVRTLRLTMPVAFAQRWFLPRLAQWDREHPDIAIEVDASPQMRDLEREGLDGAIRSVDAGGPGLAIAPLYATPTRLLAVAAPAVAERLQSIGPAGLRGERLLGHREEWSKWFAAARVAGSVTPVAGFNSLTLRLNAVEQGLGVGLARDILVADAVRRDALRPLFDIARRPDDLPPHSLVWRTASPHAAALSALAGWLAREAAASLRD